jgi:hypothetical protein
VPNCVPSTSANVLNNPNMGTLWAFVRAYSWLEAQPSNQFVAMMVTL